jgi:two-component system, NtrC family, sensor kinase
MVGASTARISRAGTEFAKDSYSKIIDAGRSVAVSLRLKTLLALLLSVLSIYAGLLNVRDRRDWKVPSDGIAWTQAATGVTVRSIVEEGAEGPQAGIAPGDLLVSVNGIPVSDLDEYTELVEAIGLAMPGGSGATYTVQKAETGERATYPVWIELRSVFGPIDWLLMMVAFAYLGIGLFIFLRHGRSSGAFHFYLICLVAFVLFLFRHSGRADLFDIGMYWASATALLLLPSLFLHFCLTFPAPVQRLKQRPALKLVPYLSFAFLFVVHAAWFTGLLTPWGIARNEGYALLLDRIQILHFAGLFFLGAAILTYAHRRASSFEERQQLKWISQGTLLGLTPFTLFYLIPYLFHLPTRFLMESSILGLILIPLSFAYAITRYRLMDVDLIFKKGVTYVAASSTVLALYVGIIVLISRAVEGFSAESSLFLFGLTALLIAVLFAPLRSRIQEALDRRFYKDQYDHRKSFSEFSKQLGSEVNLPRLTERICDRLEKGLNVSQVAIFLRDEHRPRLFHLLSQGDNGDTGELTLEVPEALFSDFDRRLNPLFLAPPDGAILELRERLSERRLSYVQPLRVRGRVIGFLALGERYGSGPLSSEDLELVASLSTYAAIALDNALLYHSLERKAGELAQLKAYSESVVESISVGVVAVTPEGEITVWNQRMQEIYGLSSNQVLGRSIESVLPRDLVITIKRALEGTGWAVKSVTRLHKTHLEGRDGRLRLVNMTFSPFVLPEDIVTGTLMIFDDVTDKVRLEDQLLQAEKLSSIGLFAAGVAHEVNTPLAGISSYAQMLIKETSAEDPRHEALKKIEKQSFRASSIVNNLLNFARFSPSEFQELNLNSVMLETLSLIESQMSKGSVEIKLDLDPSLPGTQGNGGKLQQVFMNLFLNARDAMPTGGELKIRTYQEDSTLVVEVGDTGVGIKNDDIKRIYDPFFTTKEVGKGTGLGLAVSYGIIQEHSGRISVSSEPGKGTTFTLQFPVKRVH